MVIRRCGFVFENGILCICIRFGLADGRVEKDISRYLFLSFSALYKLVVAGSL